MKLVFCLAWSLLLGNSIVDSGAVGVVEQLETCNGSDDKGFVTTFSDLYEDCLFLILKQSDFASLLNVRQFSEKYSSVAVDVFRHKYSHFQIIFEDSFALPNKPSELLMVADMQIDSDIIERVNRYIMHTPNIPPRTNEIEKNVELKNGDAILDTFKHFGHLIKKLKSKTQSGDRPLQSELIGKLISKYSSESLVEIEIESDGKEVLEHITKPLINVESVTFRQCKMSFNPQKIRPNEIFPAVRRLNFYKMGNKDLAYFDHYMPHLTHVTMHDSMFGYVNDGRLCPAVFIKNSQIRSVDLAKIDNRFVRELNAILPQLETLTLSNVNLRDGESIQFNNVSTLLILDGEHTSPVNLRFPRLEMLHLDYHSRNNFDEYFQFLNEHNHLKRLHLMHMGQREINDEQFQTLSANLMDLVEFTLHNKYGAKGLSVNAIVEFLRSHDNVQRVTVIDSAKNWEVELQRQLEQDWDVLINGNSQTFTRKTNDQN